MNNSKMSSSIVNNGKDGNSNNDSKKTHKKMM